MRRLCVFFLMIFVACTSDNEDNYFSIDCDEDNISYDSGVPRSISEIVSNKCLSCHLEGNTISFIDLDSYDKLIQYSNLDDVINNVTNPMPPSGSPHLTDCEKTQVENWVNNGFPL